MDIQALINKIIPLKGILRIPSWWMKNLLTEIVGYIDDGDTVNGRSIKSVKNDIATLKKSLHTQKCIVVETGESAGYVMIDGVKQEIPVNTKRVIRFVDTFKFFDEKAANLNYNYVRNIDFIVTDTSSITDMGGMFRSCYSIENIDLTGIDTSAVTDMSYMFSADIDAQYSRSNIRSIIITGLDTSAVTNMESMFRSCTKLTSLDLSSFNTSAVTNMGYMFGDCSSLTSLDLSSFGTSAVTDMSYMFGGCTGLTSLDLSNFNTSAVTDMSYMFRSCTKLTSLDLSNFDTSAVTDMSNMFGDCTALRNIKCKQAFKDWCVANASTISLTVANITWEIVQ